MISSSTTSAEEAMKITKSVSYPNILIKCLGFAKLGFSTLNAFNQVTIQAPFIGTICSIFNIEQIVPIIYLIEPFSYNFF